MRTNRVFSVLLLVLASTLVGAGCSAPAAPAPPPPVKPVADVQQLMAEVTDPATDVIWGSFGTIITAEGTEERFPKTDEDWMAVRNAAMTVTESGNLLMMPGRAKDNEEWMRLSGALIDVGSKALKVIDAKDVPGLFNVGGEIYVVCVNCHTKYIDEINEGAAAPR
jgi:hypothetical protein